MKADTVGAGPRDEGRRAEAGPHMAVSGVGLELAVADESELQAAAGALGRYLAPGDCIALSGPLGAGKTTFTRGLAAALGVDPGVVTSPTFALLHHYHGRLPLCHADTYRLDDPAELWELGLADCLAERQAVVVIEWAERLRESLPPERLDVTITWPRPAASQALPAGRVLQAVGRGRRGQELVEAWRQALGLGLAAGGRADARAGP